MLSALRNRSNCDKMNAERRMRRGRKSNFARQDVSEIKRERGEDIGLKERKEKPPGEKRKKKTGALIAAHEGRDPSGYADT